MGKLIQITTQFTDVLCVYRNGCIFNSSMCVYVLDRCDHVFFYLVIPVVIFRNIIFKM